MNIKIKIFFLIYIFSFSSYSQEELKVKTDSLKEEVKISDNIKKVDIYYELYKAYRGKNLDSAEYFSKKSHEFALKSNDEKIIGYSWLNLGNMQFDRAMSKESLKSFKNSMQIGLKLQDSVLLSRAYKDLGTIHSYIGNFNLSIEYILKALPIFEQLNNEADIANTYISLGTNLHRSKKFKEAILYNEKALVIYKKLKNKTNEGIAYNNLANSSNGLEEYNKSIEFAKIAIDIFEELGYTRFAAFPTGNMAISYDSLKNYNVAKKLYLKVIKIHENNSDYYELAFMKNGLANLFLKNKNYKDAILTAKESLKNAEKIDNLEFKIYSSKTLAKAYKKIENHKKSGFFFEKYATLKDSLFKTEEQKSQLELKEKYETSKKEKEIAIQKEQLLVQELAIKNKSLYAILLLASLIILGVVFYSIYKKNQFKRKQLQKEIDLKDALSIIKTQNRLQEQRLRISRDLHDNIGSQLTFIISSVDNLKYISKDANKKLKDKLSNISSFTSETIHQLRDTIWAMNKSEITVEDLHTRALSFVEKAKKATQNIDFEVNQKIKKEITLSSLKGMNIFRVIQESINNSIKYAEASKISVLISEEDNKLAVIIKDNGIGFDIKTVDLGNGLSNMEKRMSEVDGKIKISSVIEKGTEIKIII